MSKKEQIIKTTIELFAKQGFENTPTSQNWMRNSRQRCSICSGMPSRSKILLLPDPS